MIMGGIFTGLILYGLDDGLYFFLSPSEIGEAHQDKKFRLGGLVKSGSIAHDNGDVRFAVTDGNDEVTVHFRGLLPDLFREEQGVVVLGRLKNGVFIAEEVLAKHDENYMPPEVVESLKKAGNWHE